MPRQAVAMVKRRLFGPRVRNAPLAVRIGVPALVIGLAIWIGGFISFVGELPKPTDGIVDTADGIVALTGGRDRIVAAMALLSAHKGERLLISGVHDQTSRADLRRLVEDPDDRFDCCVDLDWQARDTEGNAVETARWAREQGFHSLIVVTAQYHMPRSLIELQRAMPECKLIPYPVLSQTSRQEWWRPSTAKVLAAEYTKFLVSIARSSVGWFSSSNA